MIYILLLNQINNCYIIDHSLIDKILLILANEAPDVLVEKAGNISLQAQELKVEHFVSKSIVLL